MLTVRRREVFIGHRLGALRHGCVKRDAAQKEEHLVEEPHTWTLAAWERWG